MENDLVYELKKTTQKIGDYTYEIETLKNLDETIDMICNDLREDPFAEDRCPYFGVLWPAAQGLSIYLSKMGEWLKGKTVIELGCGLALPSMVCAKLGAKVTATDFHPDVPKFLARNLKNNKIDINYVSMDWRKDRLGTFDFVVASDVLYENKHPRDVAESFASHCHKESTILLADPGRSYLQIFADEMKKLNFRSDMFIREVPVDGEMREIFVFSFQRV